MNIQHPREARHGLFKLAVALLPVALLLGCNSAPTGTAPGLAGGQALTPGITNYPMMYVKQPVLVKNTNKKNTLVHSCIYAIIINLIQFNLICQHKHNCR